MSCCLDRFSSLLNINKANLKRKMNLQEQPNLVNTNRFCEAVKDLVNKAKMMLIHITGKNVLETFFVTLEHSNSNLGRIIS
jgi:hypothetical protein